jgi:hypothetical protein
MRLRFADGHPDVEHFHNHHLAIGSWASDWNAMWESWVSTKIDIDDAQRRKTRARAFAMNRLAWP